MPTPRRILRPIAFACLALALLCAVVWALSGWGGVAYVWSSRSLSIGNGAIDYHNPVSLGSDGHHAEFVWRTTSPPSWYSMLEGSGTLAATWFMVPLWIISLAIAFVGGSLLLLSRTPVRPLTDAPDRRRRRTMGNACLVLAVLIAAAWALSSRHSWQYAYSGWAYRIQHGKFGYAPTPSFAFLFSPTSSHGWAVTRIAPDRTSIYGLSGTPAPRFTAWPFWPFSILLAATGGTLLYFARTRSPFSCPTCAYDLRGLPASTPCPECGTPIAPASPPRTPGATPIDSPPNLPTPPTGTA